jgi:hypothetical protein
MTDDDPIIFADADEARAWDGYYCAAMAQPPILNPDTGVPYHEPPDALNSVSVADAMLRERRKRCVRRCTSHALLNIGDNLYRDARCALPDGHEGEHIP